MKKYILIIYYVLFSNIIFAQVVYNMQNLTVNECEGILKDSESNALNPSWYSHDENLILLFVLLMLFKLLLHLMFFLQSPLMIM